jgi:hypothetical protein
MASRNIIVDDLDGTEGAETIRFGLDGSEFVIDLAPENHEKLRKALEPFVASARRDGLAGQVRRSTRPSTAKVKKTASVSAEPEQQPVAAVVTPLTSSGRPGIREWANSHGYSVGARGRIPSEIQSAYLAAMRESAG